MAKSAANVAQINAKKDRKQMFSQKARYQGPTAVLTVFVRETPNGKFKTYALHEKAGQEKKLKGVLTEHATKEQALAKFNELGQQALAAGWTLKAASAGKSAFDAIPAAE